MDMLPADADNPDRTGGADGFRDDQIDDWLWDLEDRYDVGAVDESFPTHLIAADDDTRLAQVRRYRRTKHDASSSGFDRDEPTGAFAVVDGDNFEPRHIPHSVPPRHRTNRWAIAAAVIVVAALGGLAWAISRRGSHSQGPNLAVAAATTTLPPALVGPPNVSVASPVGDTTPSTPPLTVVGVPPTTTPSGRVVFTPTATTVAPRSTTPTTSHPKTTTATTSPPRTTPTTPPVVTPPPTNPTTPPTNPPPTTVPTVTTTPPTTSPPPSTVPLGG
jgi:hypothetical protein